MNPLIDKMVNSEEWYFEHRNIQEYFAALMLSELEINEIIAIIGHSVVDEISKKPRHDPSSHDGSRFEWKQSQRCQRFRDFQNGIRFDKGSLFGDEDNAGNIVRLATIGLKEQPLTNSLNIFSSLSEVFKSNISLFLLPLLLLVMSYSLIEKAHDNMF